MKTYAKGFRSEHDLLRILNSHGYSCIRSASSGGPLTPVDIVALKAGKTLCFEIKSWSRKPRLEKKKLEQFSAWCSRAQGMGFLAWYNLKKWLFLPLNDAEEGRYGDENWVSLESFLKVFV